MDMLYCALWFVAGAFSYRIVSRLMQYGAMLHMYTQVLICSLAILRMTEDNIITAQQKRREAETKAGESKESIAKNDNIESKAMVLWRELSITTIINLTPSPLRPAIKFKNWRQAMNFLDSSIKRS